MSGTAPSRSFSDALWDLLEQGYGRLRGGVKVLAEDAEGSPGAAQNWLRRRNLPQGERLIALMAANPAVNDLVQQAVAKRIATTKTRRAAWRTTYDAALGAVPAAEAGGAGGLERGLAHRAGDVADTDRGRALGVDRRVAR